MWCTPRNGDYSGCYRDRKLHTVPQTSHTLVDFAEHTRDGKKTHHQPLVATDMPVRESVSYRVGLCCQEPPSLLCGKEEPKKTRKSILGRGSCCSSQRALRAYAGTSILSRRRHRPLPCCDAQGMKPPSRSPLEALVAACQPRAGMFFVMPLAW